MVHGPADTVRLVGGDNERVGRLEALHDKVKHKIRAGAGGAGNWGAAGATWLTCYHPSQGKLYTTIPHC